METELEFIINLMDKEINLDTLKKIKQRMEKIKRYEHVEYIKENSKIPTPTTFIPSTKTIQVNYEKVLEYLKNLDDVIKADMPKSSEKDIKMFKLLTTYRMYIYEMYRLKQIHDAFETNEKDLETQITRSIYNIINRMDYLEKTIMISKQEIIKAKTSNANKILFEYSDINPLERKAEIESFKYIRKMLLPIRSTFENVYDEMYLMELSKMISGYDKAPIPYIRILELLKQEDKNFEIEFPYGCESVNSFLNASKTMSTEKERFELGLNIEPETLNKTYQLINRMLGD